MPDIHHILKTYWGYEAFRPLQEESIQATLQGRDSFTILPTGGGKSLCYQLPSLCFEGKVALVVSPLIALMKDQVDSARNLGIAADFLNSTLSSEEQRQVIERVYRNETRLLYMAPERFAQSDLIANLVEAEKIAYFAIDEAHCISQWGHDFRPDYREMGRLKAQFPQIGIHAFTATATPQVQEDIVNSLRLVEPQVLIGDYDRPNLHYAVRHRPSGQKALLEELCQWLDQHRDEAGIIYCISRADVDRLSTELAAQGYSVVPYHAGLGDSVRKRNQDAFMSESADIVVATVAFGMGIDRSNIRYVIHTGMPKSLEHYQQEAGRAGRDGLPSDCILYVGARDALFWAETFRQASPEFQELSTQKLNDMQAYCHAFQCRHRFLVEYFGQAYEKPQCAGCDICLSGVVSHPDSVVMAQKILSCVWRVGERQNVTYVGRVLMGSRDERILKNGHDSLSTYGMMKGVPKSTMRQWIEELVGQRYLVKQGLYGNLALTDAGKRLLKGQVEPVHLSVAPESEDLGARKPAMKDVRGWEGVDRELFERLRALRKELAAAYEVPPFIIFSDVTLRDMARRVPQTEQQLLAIPGVGSKKLESFGARFLAELRRYAETHSDLPTWNTPMEAPVRFLQKPETREQIFNLLDEGKDLEEIAQIVERTPGTVLKYLVEYIQYHAITDTSLWVTARNRERILEAAKVVGDQKLRPIFDYLDGEVPYDQIRIVLAVAQNLVSV